VTTRFGCKTKIEKTGIKISVRNIWCNTLGKDPKMFESWWGSSVRHFSRAERLGLTWLTRVPDLKLKTLNEIMKALEKPPKNEHQLAQWSGARFVNVNIYPGQEQSELVPNARLLNNEQQQPVTAAVLVAASDAGGYNVLTYDAFPQLRHGSGGTSSSSGATLPDDKGPEHS
jgi:hypothetical protein